jgi:hypothetical protein
MVNLLHCWARIESEDKILKSYERFADHREKNERFVGVVK